MIKVGIIDYGVGNLSSLSNTLSKIGCNSIISNQIMLLENCDVIILPGVGTFKYAMVSIKKYKLDFFIKEFAQNLKVIGICLGMQLFAESSTEGGKNKGLGLIKGEVIKIKNNSSHIGWNNISLKSKSESFKEFDNHYFYFNHSYYLKTNSKSTLFVTNYSDNFVSAFEEGNILGLQFHPEKSQIMGKKLLSTALNT